MVATVIICLMADLPFRLVRVQRITCANATGFPAVVLQMTWFIWPSIRRPGENAAVPDASCGLLSFRARTRGGQDGFEHIERLYFHLTGYGRFERDVDDIARGRRLVFPVDIDIDFFVRRRT